MRAERKGVPRRRSRIYKYQELKKNIAQFSKEEDEEELTAHLNVLEQSDELEIRCYFPGSSSRVEKS